MQGGDQQTHPCPSQCLCSPDHTAAAFRHKGSHAGGEIVNIGARRTHMVSEQQDPVTGPDTVRISTRVNLACLLEKSPTLGAPTVAQRAPQRQDSAKREGDSTGSHLPQWTSAPYPGTQRQWYLSSPSGTHVPPFWHGWESQGSKQDRGEKDRESAGSLPLAILCQREHRH